MSMKQGRWLKAILGRPESMVLTVFAAFIVLGTLILSLPIFHARDGVSLLDTLFTITSAVCVTGLTSVDISKEFNLLGQSVILLFIQIGGLGIMTLAALAVLVGRSKLSLSSQALIGDVVYQRDNAQFISSSIKSIFLLTFAIEAIGAVLIYFSLPSATTNRAFAAIFHGISAFCNAGFSTFSDNLMSQAHNGALLATIASLIILGGIGYPVFFDVLARLRVMDTGHDPTLSLSFSSRVILRVSGILIVLGAVALLLTGLGPAEVPLSDRLAASIFQSISARTAGFNTVDLAFSPLSALLIICFLMFIGGSPCSCAGGVKTTTFAIWVATLRAQLRRCDDVTIGNRRISHELVAKVSTIMAMAFLFNLLGVVLLSCTESAGLDRILFEQISAFGTVGLSTGITSTLSPAGKLWIILTMFIGRVGPLTLGGFLIGRRLPLVRMPEEHIVIG